MQSLTSRRVAPSEQGELQGANGALFGISAMIGPGLLTQTFSYSIGGHAPWHFPGAPFLVACTLLGAALWVAATRRTAEPAATSPSA